MPALLREIDAQGDGLFTRGAATTIREREAFCLPIVLDPKAWIVELHSLRPR